MSTILVLLDAFRHDYLTEKNTPFLWKCAQEGANYAGVEQSLGFCERSEILTGLRGDVRGFFTAIGFDPANSPYIKTPLLNYLEFVEKYLLLGLNFFPLHFGSRVHKKLRHLVSCHLKKRKMSMSAYLIPFTWLPYFALTEDRIDHRDPKAFPMPSILSLLEGAGGTYLYDTFSALNIDTKYRTDCDRFDAVIRDFKVFPKDLYLVYVAATDEYGHRYGPDSHKFQVTLRQLDKNIEKFVHDTECTNRGNNYLFLGDHGMLPVTSRMDAEKEISTMLRTTGLYNGKDVIYFLDSTMVRFWTMSEKARNSLPGILYGTEIFNRSGSWMNDALAKRYHVPWPDRRYGDLLWIANPGVLVFPDFFHRFTPCKGMHGYDPALPESQGMCILWGKGIPSSKHPVMPLTNTFNLLKSCLNL
jgi:hypothetical protein